MKKMRKRNVDQGFTLVEVLVAVVVLAVVVLPLLNSFVTASRTNAKAKKLMDATTAAQNVFEELKGEKLDDFISAYTETQEIIMKDPTNPQLDVNGEEMYRHILPENGHPENFRISVDQRSFLARVTIDPLDYTTKQGDPVKDSDYNSQLFSTISELSSSSNAFFIQQVSDNLDDTAAEALAPDTSAASVENTKNNMSRTITIDVDYNVATKLCEVFATLSYSDTAGGSYTPINQYRIYSNNIALSNTLSNIFVCFLPMYSPTGTKLAPKEKIVINNPTNYPVGIYIAKQTDYDAGADMVAKNNYSIELEVNEGNRVWDKAITQITTNLKYVEGDNIASELTKVSCTGPTSIPSSMKKALDIRDNLSRPDTSIHIYKVTVEIFEKDDVAYAEALTKMEGTKIE